MATVFNLPDEILLKIFSNLDVMDLITSVSDVCRKWNCLANDSVLWNTLELTVDKSQELDNILKLLPVMEQLKLVRFQWRTDVQDLINALASYCPHLIGIKLICCGFYSRDDISKLVQCYPNLKVFSLAKSWSIPPQCLDDVASFKQLSSLNLSNCLLTPAQFHLISENCTKIHSINVDYVRGLTEHDIVAFISPRTSTLEAITVFGELLTNNIFHHLERCFRLKLLHISTCRNFTDICFKALNNMTHLQSITLRKSVQFSAKVLQQFYFYSKTVKNLTHLYISAKRSLTRDDVSVWPTVDESHIDQFCTCILTKDGFKTYLIPQ